MHILEGGMTSWQEAGGDVTVGNTTRWAMDRQVRFVAGIFAIVAVVASIFVPGLEWIAAGVGAGLAYSAVSNTCAMAAVLAKLPYNRTNACDITGILEELKAA